MLEYLSTLYKCRCQCGEIFYVNVGSIFSAEITHPKKTSTTCPACGRSAFLAQQGRVASTRQSPLAAKRKARPALQLHNDLPEMERMLKHFQQQAALHENHLAALTLVANRAIHAWQGRWGESVMKPEFQSIIHTLKEIESE